MATALQDAHPAFRAGLAMALNRLDHEGTLSVIPDAKIYEASRDGVTLALAISPRGRPSIVAARHHGAVDQVMRGACEALCFVLEGLPAQEAAEHGVIHLIESLRDPTEPYPVAGIMTPKNTGEVFLQVERLVRDICHAHQADTGSVSEWNQWNPKVQSEWLRRSKDDQASVLKPIVAEQVLDEGLTGDDLWISDIERNIRVIMSFGPGVSADRKPAILMRLEGRMRKATGNRLEVFAEEMTDKNVIRRM